MKITQKIIPALATAFAIASFALPAFAASCGSTPGALVNPLNVCTIQDLLTVIMSFVVWIGGVILTLMLIYVGFLFVSARGSEEKISQARTALLWTVIGGLILLGASAIASVIAATVSSFVS